MTLQLMEGPPREGMGQVFNIAQVAELLGKSYGQVWYAIHGGAVTPLQAGHARLFTQRHIETLRQHFDGKGETCKQEQC